MAKDFPLFPSLPPELRFHIWRLALTSPWSCTVAKRTRRTSQIKTLGTHPHIPISQACAESHHTLTKTHTYIERLGWFHFPRYLLFMQHLRMDPGHHRLQGRYRLFDHVQHLVLNPSSRELLYETLELLTTLGTVLRSVVIVAPWFLPDERDTYDANLDWIAPYENWSCVISKFPAGVDLATLVGGIERGAEDDCVSDLAHGLSLGEYRTRLDKAVGRLPDPLPDGLRLVDNVYWRTSRMLSKVESYVREIPTTPKLYLQTVEQIRPIQDVPSYTRPVYGAARQLQVPGRIRNRPVQAVTTYTSDSEDVPREEGSDSAS